VGAPNGTAACRALRPLLAEGGVLDPGDQLRMLILTESDIRRVLDLTSCIEAVEAAFQAHGEGSAFALNRIHVGLAEGAFHLVSGGYRRPHQSNFSVKLTGVFPSPPGGVSPRGGGVVVLSDASDGRVLAVLGSRTLTRMRTAAVTAVAARYLARPEATCVLLVGAGSQAQSQVEALRCVRPIRSAAVWSIDSGLATDLVASLRAAGTDATVASNQRQAARNAAIIVTVTPSTEQLLSLEDVAPGTFIAALGADAPHKQELDPALVARSRLVVDVVGQCAAAGELHHAIEAGLMCESDVYSELGAIVAGTRPGRTSADELIVFDSTGTALQDAAVARLAWTRALHAGVGTQMDMTA
jgi:alanine dehydrogenase